MVDPSKMPATPEATQDVMDPAIFQQLGQEMPPQLAVDVLQKLLPHLTPKLLQYVAALMHTPDEFNAKWPEYAPQPPASSGMTPGMQPAGAAAPAAPAAAPASPAAATGSIGGSVSSMSTPTQAALAPKPRP